VNAARVPRHRTFHSLAHSTARIAALLTAGVLLVAVAFGNAALPGWAQGVAPPPSAPAEIPAEQRTSAYFETIRDAPLALAAFLHTMPKGGDLHNHPIGAAYAERFITYAAEDGLCVVRATMTLVAPTPPCDAAAGRPAASSALADQQFYDALVDAWSMRNWDAARDSGHDQFFGTFGRFGEVWNGRVGDVLADVIAQAAAENVMYLELMFGVDGNRASPLGQQVGWDNDLGRLHARLLAAGMDGIVAEARRDLDAAEARVRERLRCGTPDADRGCEVTVRYLQTATRILPPERVFAQFVAGYELVRADPRVVGVNLLAPEDAYVARRDYRLHMAMLDYLHGVAPHVPIALHAGELAPGLVPPDDLRFHVRAAVEQGHARRIGHGVAVMYEDDPFGLLAEMAQRNVLVEILLVSNAQILLVAGPHHPFPYYWAAGVPLALATDDAGVSRSTMAAQYQHAVEGYGLSYPDLKRLARQSVEHAFLPGASLWERIVEAAPVAACAGEPLGGPWPTAACSAFLEGSERAREQWRLEGAFAAFESRY
jgi:adenosine deaminase